MYLYFYGCHINRPTQMAQFCHVTTQCTTGRWARFRRNGRGKYIFNFMRFIEFTMTTKNKNNNCWNINHRGEKKTRCLFFFRKSEWSKSERTT